MYLNFEPIAEAICFTRYFDQNSNPEEEGDVAFQVFLLEILPKNQTASELFDNSSQKSRWFHLMQLNIVLELSRILQGDFVYFFYKIMCLYNSLMLLSSMCIHSSLIMNFVHNNLVYTTVVIIQLISAMR